ncbi:MAG: NAD(P)H-hydrate dehydratase [Salinibacterium sp.]|nr:NAD(P)H-hydrate dehydratase [Salinibacterium sp.]
MDAFTDWTMADAARHIAVPRKEDDKYSRGVLGVITGSERYPGAAVIGVEAALRTGVGMLRFLGHPTVSELVLQRRPEAVPAAGLVQAWLIGSGIDSDDTTATTDAAITTALRESVPVVLDGASVRRHAEAAGAVVITPHYRELSRLVASDAATIAANPARAAREAADGLGVTVLLKGHITWVAAPGVLFRVAQAPTWLATAGAGDALGGILGALVATHTVEASTNSAQLAELAATAALLHGRAATRASAGGPFTILELCGAIPATVAELLSEQRSR